MARGIIVARLIKKAHMGNRSEYKNGPWRVIRTGLTGGALFHYGTKMLEWVWDDRSAKITGWWAGWGSMSDQQGVNAALDALGSTLRYYRDTRGGGPRVNPASYRVSATVGRMVNAITPPDY